MMSKPIDRGNSSYRTRAAAALLCAALAPACAAADSTAKSASRPAGRSDIERGRYLVTVAGCNDCHTPNFLLNGHRTPQKDLLTGVRLGWRGPWGTSYPDNLRQYFQFVTEEQWLQVAKEVQRRPSMPYSALNAMTARDLKAIYRYIRHLGPAGEAAPKFVPPGGEPPQPYVLFPAPYR
jgi:mono/diheme cytochrome c family protein